MKITNIETFIVDAGWRPWIFVKVESDNGLIGYGECSEARTPLGVVGTIRDMSDILIGTDTSVSIMFSLSPKLTCRMALIIVI